MNDWPGRRHAEGSRQWPTLEAVVRRVEQAESVDGLLVLGSFADGRPDELSDIDLVAIVAPGHLAEAWAGRLRLAGDALVTWDSRPISDSRPQWFNWLARDVVKVECGFVDPTTLALELAEPFAVLIGEPVLAETLPRISRAEVQRRAAAIEELQRDVDPDEMTPGERVGWKLSELKRAVRSAQRHDPA